MTDVIGALVLSLSGLFSEAIEETDHVHSRLGWKFEVKVRKCVQGLVR